MLRFGALKLMFRECGKQVEKVLGGQCPIASVAHGRGGKPESR